MKILYQLQKNISLLCICINLLCSGAVTNQDESVSFDEIMYNWSRTLAEAFQLANQKHYKISNPEQCMIKAIDAFLSNVDPHSNLLDPKTYKAMLESTSGEFFGIGVVIDNTRNSKDKHLTIIDTVPDGPSDRAGLKPFDKIIEIEGKPLEGMTTDEATSMLKGERNTKVHIKIVRENSPELFSFDITRDIIKEQNSLCFYLEKQDIYYLSLTMFNENSAHQLEQLLLKTQTKKYKGLILDLRNNSGGLLTSAIDIAGLFLDKGSLVVTTKDKNGTVQESYKTTRDPIASSIPIFILINNFTASAAEILAGALKIHADGLAPEKTMAKRTSDSKQHRKNNHMVFLVGTKTYGKGSVQEVIPISNNCAAKITTALYFLPDGSSVQAVGISPDFEVERYLPPTDQQQWISKFYGREQALTNHIKINPSAQEKKDEPKSGIKNWTERARTMLLSDNQFLETIGLMNLFAIGNTTCSLPLDTRAKAIDFMSSVFIASKDVILIDVKN